MRVMRNPTVRASIAAGAFAVIGFLSWEYFAPDTKFLLPDTIFYIVIVINTYFSVKFFTRIGPVNRSQFATDALLVAAYIGLAFTMGHPLAFLFAGLCIFIAATPKYTLMLGEIPHEKVLRKKILIDLSGVALCAAVLGGALADWPLTSAWALAIIFTLANIYLLLIQPMYRL